MVVQNFDNVVSNSDSTSSTDTTAKVPRICSFHWCHLLGIMPCSCHAGALTTQDASA